MGKDDQTWGQVSGRLETQANYLDTEEDFFKPEKSPERDHTDSVFRKSKTLLMMQMKKSPSNATNPVLKSQPAIRRAITRSNTCDRSKMAA